MNKLLKEFAERLLPTLCVVVAATVLELLKEQGVFDAKCFKTKSTNGQASKRSTRKNRSRVNTQKGD